MSSRTSRALVAAVGLGLFGLTLSACSSNESHALGKRSERNTRQVREARERMQKGDQLINQGESQTASGETLQGQGKEGEGQTLIDKGNANVDKAKKMKDSGGEQMKKMQEGLGGFGTQQK